MPKSPEEKLTPARAFQSYVAAGDELLRLAETYRDEGVYNTAARKLTAAAAAYTLAHETRVAAFDAPIDPPAFPARRRKR